MTAVGAQCATPMVPVLGALDVSVFPMLLQARLQQARQGLQRTRGETHRRSQWEVPLLQLIVEWESRYRAGLLDEEAADRILTAVPPLAHINHARDVAETSLLGEATYLPPLEAPRNPPLPPIDDNQHR